MKDIAIIGLSGRFPEADSVDAFRKNLINGNDSVRDLSNERISATTVDPSKAYKPYAFMEDVDRFDHAFFTISRSEAEHMDPHQRIVLEVVYEAIESSGYNPDVFSGTETAVFIGDTDQEYYRHAERFDPTLLTGNTSATTAGRISRFFNFRGIATMVDTACSSSLVAIHLACNELDRGDAEYAIACGVRFILFPEEKAVQVDLGIMATDGKTKSFSDKADGSGAGEAVGCVLLKPLDKALADNDPIFAVIKGTAANQDAQLSGSLTAPSSQAQAEVIAKAWKRAGIDPLTIGYIETHGSGTKLGDPIEVGGITQAFRAHTDQKQFVQISSLKTNIGHTGGSAGISGLIKAVLSLKYREHYPSLHFDTPNPFIDFANSAVNVNTTYRAWEAAFPRRAGVSSFGLSGTNCHVVLEEAPQREATEHAATDEVFVFSAKTANSLKNYLAEFTAWIGERKDTSLKDIAYTLSNGRKHYNYRAALTASELSELKNQLSTEKIIHTSIPVKRLIFLFSDTSDTSAQLGEHLAGSDAEFRTHWENCRAVAGVWNANTQHFALQYSLYRTLENRGITTENLLGMGVGDEVVGVILGEQTLTEGLQNAVNSVITEPEDLDKRLLKLVNRETDPEAASTGKTDRVAFIELGTENGFSKGLHALRVPDKDERYTVFSFENESTPAKLAGFLFTEHYPLNWNSWYERHPGVRIPLPTYRFEKTRCWLKEPLVITGNTIQPIATVNGDPAAIPSTDEPSDYSSVQHLINPDWTPTEQQIAAIWIAVLKLDQLSLTDDFFLLGGHSLMATRVIARIEKVYGLKLVFKDIFTFATVKSLAAGVDELLASGAAQRISVISRAPEADFYPLSHAQKRLWLIHELDGGQGLAYNLPAALRVRGELDLIKVQQVTEELILRHESLRTVFEEQNGVPVQRILPLASFEIEQFTGTEANVTSVQQQFLRPFDLTKAPLLRIGVIQLSSGTQILLFDMHHIISDGISLGVIAQEFIELYGGAKLTKPELHYRDYAVWQQEQFANGAMQVQENYWMEQFAQPVSPLALPFDRPRNSNTNFAGDVLTFEMDAELSSSLRELSRKTGTTLYMLLLAAYNVLLYKYTSRTDIVVGSPIAGRPHDELEPIVGMFVNTLAMRNKPEGSLSFAAFLDEVKTNCLQAYEHQEYPFELILERTGANTLFQTMFVLQNLSQPVMELDGIRFEAQEFPTGTAQFDWTMEVNEHGDSLLVNLFYNTSLFDLATIQLLKERWLLLLQGIVENPARAIGELPFSVASKDDAVELDFDLNF